MTQSFNDQTGQPVGCGVGQQRRVETNRTRTAQNGDWASQPDERQKRVAPTQRRRSGCQGIQRPAACYQKAYTRPDRNSVFHAAAPGAFWINHLTGFRKIPREFKTSRGRNPIALTICARSARILKALRNGEPVVSPSWACGAAGSALPWHGRGRRFDPDQVHQFPQQLKRDEGPNHGVCVMVCVITGRFGAYSKGFIAARFASIRTVAVPLQRPTTDV